MPLVSDDDVAPIEPVTARVVVAPPSVASDHRGDGESGPAALERARHLLASGETALSLAVLRDHARRFPRSDLAEERDYLTFRARACDSTRVGVEREADRFLQRYPCGIYSSHVRSMRSARE